MNINYKVQKSRNQSSDYTYVYNHADFTLVHYNSAQKVSVKTQHNKSL